MKYLSAGSHKRGSNEDNIILCVGYTYFQPVIDNYCSGEWLCLPLDFQEI